MLYLVTDNNFSPDPQTHYGRQQLALWNCYGSYSLPSTSFYKTDDEQGFAVLHYASCTLSGNFKKSSQDELTAFLLFHRPMSIQCPPELTLALPGYQTVFREMFEFSFPESFKPTEKNIAALLKTPSLDQVFAIENACFPNLKRDVWIPDISHQTRHGSLQLYLQGDSVAVQSYCLYHQAFFSQIATHPAKRGKGQARQLLFLLAYLLKSRGITGSLFARPERRSFYSQIGFLPVYQDNLYELPHEPYANF